MRYLLGLLNSEMRGNAPANIIRRVHVRLPRRRSERERSKRCSVWEKRDAIRQGYRLTRVPVRDQFNRIPRDRTGPSSMNHPLPAEPRNVRCTRASGSLLARDLRGRRKSLQNSCTVTWRRLLRPFPFVRTFIHIPSQYFLFSSLIKVSLTKNKKSYFIDSYLRLILKRIFKKF